MYNKDENKNKQILSYKQKLETLCRDIQKSITSITEMNKKVIEDEANKRDEISSNFQVSLEDINSKI
jgi:hypothetical protein